MAVDRKENGSRPRWHGLVVRRRRRGRRFLTTTVRRGAKRSSRRRALPRAQTLYTTGTQWGPYSDFNPLQPWDYATGRVGSRRTRRCSATTRSRTSSSRGSRRTALEGQDVYVVDAAQRREVERRQAVHRRRREVHLRDRQDRRPTFHHAVDDGPAERHRRQGNMVQLHASRARRTTRSGTPTSTTSRSSRSTSGRATARTTIVTGNIDDTSKLVGTGPYVVRRAAQTRRDASVWNKRAGWWATKALGMRSPPQYIVDIHNTSATPPRWRTCWRATST